MLDKIKDLFKDGLQYTHTAGIIQQLGNLLQILNAQFMKDENGKNAGIDAVCEILQSHKDLPAIEAQKAIEPSPQIIENAVN